MATKIKKNQLISNFRVIECLPESNGGMAYIVKAQNIKNSDIVALKISKSSEFNDFNINALKAEVRILQILSHPGIVRIYPIQSDIGKKVYMERAVELKGSPWFFIMEYLEGGSVGDLIKKNKTLSEEETGAILYRVIDTLEYIHNSGYAHNDIKASNILFRHALGNNRPFEPVPIDFGITSRKDRVQTDAGSLFYMAPEQLQEMREQRPPEIKIDYSKVDVYAIGVLLYRMLAGKLPLSGKSETGITTAILTKMPSSPQSLNPKISNHMNDLIMACLAKQPEARPTDKQIRFALRQYADYTLSAERSRSY
jgi:serine/threonine-protein kinase